MAKRKSQSIPDDCIPVTPIHRAHFTDGDGIFLLDVETGEKFAFLHQDHLESHPPELLSALDCIDDATHQLDFLSRVLAPGDHLELSPDVQLGLSSIMHNLRSQLSHRGR